MARYLYKAIGADGVHVDGDMEAENQNAVIEQLQANGLFPLEAHAANHALRARRDGLSNDELLNFTRDLGTMLDAGLALDEALATLAKVNRKATAKRSVDALRAAVEAGKPLSAAAEAADPAFTPFYVNLVRAGEATGRVAASLFRLADYLERRRALSRAVISAVAYPAVLFVVAAASLVVLLLFVVPRFEPLFADLGGALPWSTEIVVGLARVLSGYWWLLVLIAVAVPLLIRWALLREHYRLRWHQWCLALPLIGPLWVRIEIAQLSRTLGVLVRDGVPLLSAVDIVTKSQRNLVLRAVLQRAATSLEQGRGLVRPLADSGYFPPLAVQLLEVGEATGSMANMLVKLADIYDDEAHTAMARALTILEPALILTMGLAVGFIIVSILLAILGLNDLVV